MKIKKLKEITINAFNFIILLIVYFTGVFLSYLIWQLYSKFKNSNKNNKTYWQKPEQITDLTTQY
ncbi:MAG: hypothetical protein QXU20_04840 [Candidatus Woesearchaeota archaeon]